MAAASTGSDHDAILACFLLTARPYSEALENQAFSEWAERAFASMPPIHTTDLDQQNEYVCSISYRPGDAVRKPEYGGGNVVALTLRNVQSIKPGPRGYFQPDLDEQSTYLQQKKWNMWVLIAMPREAMVYLPVS